MKVVYLARIKGASACVSAVERGDEPLPTRVDGEGGGGGLGGRWGLEDARGILGLIPPTPVYHHPVKHGDLYHVDIPLVYITPDTPLPLRI